MTCDHCRKEGAATVYRLHGDSCLDIDLCNRCLVEWVALTSKFLNLEKPRLPL